jgi:hypothetical protein
MKEEHTTLWPKEKNTKKTNEACWWLFVGIPDYSINKTNHREIVDIF